MKEWTVEEVKETIKAEGIDIPTGIRASRKAISEYIANKCGIEPQETLERNYLFLFEFLNQPEKIKRYVQASVFAEEKNGNIWTTDDLEKIRVYQGKEYIEF